MRFGSTKLRFTSIFKKQGWGQFESISGPGSSISMTNEIRDGIEKLIVLYDIKTILDIPSGDFNWMKEVDLSDVNYIGADIVEELVEINNKRFRKNGIEFIQLDIIRDALPKVDLIISRDCFIHFSFTDIYKSIRNIKDSKSKYLLASTYPDVDHNVNIRTGFNFNINLESKPFYFPPPLHLIEEKEQHGQKHGRKCIGLWLIDDLILQ